MPTTPAPFVARLEAQGRFLMAVPFFTSHAGDQNRRITVERDPKAAPGDLVLLRTSSKGRGKVVRVLGKPDVARDVVEALMYDRGLQRRFPPGVERAAEEAVDAASAADPAGGARLDLRALPTFTVDPATARDFDDAISAEALDDRRARIWVHIADVSAYVRPGSTLDREAYRRGTSVYVPGAVEPMLPEALSNRACSLVPGEDRLAVTVALEYDRDRVTSVSFHRSTIRSDKRLSYEEVDAIFAGEAETEEPWGGPLAVARRVSAGLQARRAASGNALSVESTEPEFRFDRQGHVADVGQSVQTESHRLIEHLMIAANEQVAKLLSGRGIPSLYRVHERPSAERVERLVDQLASLGVPTPPVPEQLSSVQAAEIVAECSRRVDRHVQRTGHGRRALTSLVLRSLQQARYDAAPLGHAGLGLDDYCHFTSPIRRYPDLICHRALLSAIGAGETEPRAGTLEEAATQCSARERDAMVIERDADDIVHCFALEKQLFERGWDTVFEGEVTGVIGAGAFLALGDVGSDGMLPVRRLGDWYELNEEATILFGERSGATIRLGDVLPVCVHRIDIPRGRIDLDPAPEVLAAVEEAHAEVTSGEPEDPNPARPARSRRKPAGPAKKPPAAPPADAPRAEGDGPPKKRRSPSDPDWEPAKPKQRYGRKSKAKAKADAAAKLRKEKSNEIKRANRKKKRKKK